MNDFGTLKSIQLEHLKYITQETKLSQIKDQLELLYSAAPFVKANRQSDYRVRAPEKPYTTQQRMVLLGMHTNVACNSMAGLTLEASHVPWVYHIESITILLIMVFCGIFTLCYNITYKIHHETNTQFGTAVFVQAAPSIHNRTYQKAVLIYPCTMMKDAKIINMYSREELSVDFFFLH